MRMSPRLTSSVSDGERGVDDAAGTISQIARGGSRWCASSSSEADPHGPFPSERLHLLWIAVVRDHLVAGAHESRRHVGTHSSQPHHSDFHAPP